jgi:dCTP deaminase
MKTRGVFPKADLLNLVTCGRVYALDGFQQSHVGVASIDVTTTGEGYEIARVLQPNPRHGETVRELLPRMGASRIALGDVLQPGSSYLVKASIDINFPPGIYGYLNAKSTSGRNFLHVRSLADRICEFDSVDNRKSGYTGELWLLLEPLVYPIVFTDQECYTQMRVFNADTRFSQQDLDALLEANDLLFRYKNREPYKQGGLSHFTHDGSIWCTLRAKGTEPIGYKAKRSREPLDLAARNVDPSEYFEPVFAEQFGDGETGWGVSLQSFEYYLLSTQEMLKVPLHVTAELVGLDRRVGDVFTHFAGFFDPGFFGTGTLEVHAARGNIFLRHQHPFARFVFESLRAPAESYGNNGTYQEQIGTRLPKQFAAWS